jgi:hypothetical protein
MGKVFKGKGIAGWGRFFSRKRLIYRGLRVWLLGVMILLPPVSIEPGKKILEQRQEQPQIPRGNDNQKGHGQAGGPS